MTPLEKKINEQAFLRMDGQDSLPRLTVGGVQVYAYFKGGELVVSVCYDTADGAVADSEGCVPTRVKLGGDEVHYEP